jgi:hypothetical protein
MNPRERHMFEHFDHLRAAQEGLERLGYYFYPIEREHTEGLVTAPLVQRIRTQIKKRGFEKVAGKVAITFTGYAGDPREIFAIPEIRTYWHHLDRELPDLPALLAVLPELNFNGPGQHLMLMGEIDAAVQRPEMGGYDVHVANAQGIIDDAVRRILQAASKYRLSHNTVTHLLEQFDRGVRHRFPRQSL